MIVWNDYAKMQTLDTASPASSTTFGRSVLFVIDGVLAGGWRVCRSTFGTPSRHAARRTQKRPVPLSILQRCKPMQTHDRSISVVDAVNVRYKLYRTCSCYCYMAGEGNIFSNNFKYITNSNIRIKSAIKSVLSQIGGEARYAEKIIADISRVILLTTRSKASKV